MGKILVYCINVDWYFALHWLDRAKAAQEAGFTVHVVTNFTKPELKRQFESHGFICHFLQISRKSLSPFVELKVLADFWGQIRKLRPDLVHCVTIKPNIYGGLVCRMLRVPYIMSITGRGGVFSGTGGRNRMVRLLVKSLYKIVGKSPVAGFIFENEDDLDFFVGNKITSSDNGRVIKGAGVDVDTYKFASPPTNQPPIIFFAARLLKWKGLDDLVSAARILRQKGVEFVLQVAGIIDSDCLDAVPERQLVAWHEEGILHWLGQRQDMNLLLAQSDMVALPTTYGEGVPRILIEAASTGRPLVATDVAGCRDIVIDGFNGLLVPSHNPPLLAEALKKLIESKQLCQEYGKNGCRLVEQEFDQRIVIRKHLEVYQHITQV